jgi:hypothetical protein
MGRPGKSEPLEHVPDGSKSNEVTPEKWRSTVIQCARHLTPSKRPWGRCLKDWSGRSPGTGAKSCPHTPSSRSTRVSGGSSLTRTRRGSAPRTRTPTVCCASASPRAPISRYTPQPSSRPPPTSSMADHGNASTGTARPRCSVPSESPPCSHDQGNPPHHNQPNWGQIRVSNPNAAADG